MIFTPFGKVLAIGGFFFLRLSLILKFIFGSLGSLIFLIVAAVFAEEFLRRCFIVLMRSLIASLFLCSLSVVFANFSFSECLG